MPDCGQASCTAPIFFRLKTPHNSSHYTFTSLGDPEPRIIVLTLRDAVLVTRPKFLDYRRRAVHLLDGYHVPVSVGLHVALVGAVTGAVVGVGCDGVRTLELRCLRRVLLVHVGRDGAGVVRCNGGWCGSIGFYCVLVSGVALLVG